MSKKVSITEVFPSIRDFLMNLKSEFYSLFNTVKKYKLMPADNKLETHLELMQNKISLIEFFIEKFSLVGYVTLNENGTICELESLSKEWGITK